MKLFRYFLLLWFLMLSLVSNTQEISNIHFEQAGKQIHIYYDLQGDQEYTIQVYSSTDNGQSWGNPLKYVIGAAGENQKPEKGKMIVWDVLAEREKLLGEVSFKIEAIPTKSFLTDARDGQTYKWVKIGEQIWMAENLNFKTKSGSWVYDNNPKNASKYGRLYDWSTAGKVCPEGWHLPTDEEWNLLEVFLGIAQEEATSRGLRGYDIGKMLKSTSGWVSDGNGIDVTGFSAIPGGFCHSKGGFYNLGYHGNWWSATEYSSVDTWLRRMYNTDDAVYRNYGSKGNGYSVRCVRN